MKTSKEWLCHLRATGDAHHHMCCLPNSIEFTEKAMEANHVLAKALEKFLAAAKGATLASQDDVLLKRHYMRVSSHFSGMGGAEFAFFIAGKLFNIDMRLVSSCDVTPECLRVACHEQTLQLISITLSLSSPPCLNAVYLFWFLYIHNK